MSTTNYVICDSRNSIIAIHRIYDSAITCFDKIAHSGKHKDIIYMISVRTNGQGVAEYTTLVKTYPDILHQTASSPRPTIHIA